jgi:hypothetical protein
MNDATAADSLPDAPRPPVNSVTLYIMLSGDFGSSIDCEVGGLVALNDRCHAEDIADNLRAHLSPSAGEPVNLTGDYGLDGRQCGKILTR